MNRLDKVEQINEDFQSETNFKKPFLFDNMLERLYILSSVTKALVHEQILKVDTKV